MDRPLDKRRKVTWKIAGKLMDPPDAEGEIFWIVEIHVIGKFRDYRNPVVTFVAGRKAREDLIDLMDKVPPVLPIFHYRVEASFKEGKEYRNIHPTVERLFDAEGRLCKIIDGKTRLAPWMEDQVNWQPEEGLWRTLITGNVRESVSIYEEIWRTLAPYLLEMSRMPEMRKMEELFTEAAPEHEELHTDTGGYDEGIDLSAIIAKEVQLLGEVAVGPKVRGFLRMPPPQKISKEKLVPEHHELHTDTGSYDE
jgi:hypothetical protein